MINQMIQTLSARLPELAWKLSARYSVLPLKLLPVGLFRYQFEVTPQSCIDEIQSDLQKLSDCAHERSSSYLAAQVTKKVNVLVRLCAIQAEDKTVGQRASFGVKAISTRQQWLKTLKEEMTRLEAQQLSLTTTLNLLKTEKKFAAILSLQAELGEVERCLTLAKETWTRAVG